MTRPGDDDVALAEADARALGAILVPQLGETLVDLLSLSDKRGVVTLGEGMQNLTPRRRRGAGSLFLISSKRGISWKNASALLAIPVFPHAAASSFERHTASAA